MDVNDYVASSIVGSSDPNEPDDLQDKVRYFQAENRRLYSQVIKLKSKQSDLYEAALSAVSSSMSVLDLKTAKRPERDKRSRKGETAAVTLADWQLGKVTPTYNSEVCARSIATLADKVVSLTEIQRAAHPVRDIHVWLIGDLVENELIFPGQGHEIDSSFFEQALVNGPEILYPFLTTMLENFENVHIGWALGNHGRIGGRASKDMKPRNNADRFLYATVKMLFDHAKEKRIHWLEDPAQYEGWYMVDKVQNTRFLLFHGDQIRGQMGIPFYGFARAVQGWASGAISEDFDHAVCGHFHQRAVLTYNQRQVFMCGSPESYNVYAQEQLKAMSKPSQNLLFVHPDHGVTAEYAVWLD